MHVQVVTYQLADSMGEVSADAFVDANREFAEAMAVVPGLLAKIWLNDPGAQTYGGLYLWRDRAAYEDFVAGELWASVLGDDSVTGLVSHDYEVNDALTKSTQPALQVV